MLLTLKDGGINKIETDSHFSDGCETCDFGSSYINDFKITMETGIIYVETDQMYEFALSDGYMMELILPSADKIKGMTEVDFFEWIKSNLQEAITRLWEITWLWIYKHRPEKYKKSIKYIGYTTYWLSEVTEDMEEDIDLKQTDTMYFWERGRLVAYRELLEELQRDDG